MGLRADGKKGSKRSLKTASKKRALPPKLIRPDDKGTEGSEGGEDKDTGGKGRRERAPRPEKKRRRGEATEESEEDAAAAAAKDAKQRRKAVAQLTGQKVGVFALVGWRERAVKFLCYCRVFLPSPCVVDVVVDNSTRRDIRGGFYQVGRCIVDGVAACCGRGDW
jgi:hypothetical protein